MDKMNIARAMARLEEKRPNAVTVWTTDAHGYKWQANIQLKKGGGWTVMHGYTMEEALIEAITSTLNGRVTHNGDDMRVPAVAARAAIREHASEDEEDRPRDRVRVERKRVEAPAKRVMDDGPDLFRGGGRERKRL